MRLVFFSVNSDRFGKGGKTRTEAVRAFLLGKMVGRALEKWRKKCTRLPQMIIVNLSSSASRHIRNRCNVLRRLSFACSPLRTLIAFLVAEGL